VKFLRKSKLFNSVPDVFLFRSSTGWEELPHVRRKFLSPAYMILDGMYLAKASVKAAGKREKRPEVTIIQKRCIQTGQNVVYYLRLSAGEYSSPADESRMFPQKLLRSGRQVDTGIMDDVTETLPAKRGRADNGRLLFACLFFRPWPVLTVSALHILKIKGVILILWQKN